MSTLTLQPNFGLAGSVAIIHLGCIGKVCKKSRITAFLVGLNFSIPIVLIDSSRTAIIFLPQTGTNSALGASGIIANLRVVIETNCRSQCLSAPFFILPPVPASMPVTTSTPPLPPITPLTATSIVSDGVIVPLQTLTVVGTGFVEGAVVNVGDVVADTIYVSPTMLNFVVPQGTVGASIPVTVTQGDQTTSPLTIDVPIDLVSADSQIAGATTTIRGTNFPTGDTVTITFLGNTSTGIPTSATELPFLIPLGTPSGTYQVSVTYQGLTSTVDLEVLPPFPQPTINFIYELPNQGGPFDVGSMLAISGTGFTNQSTITVGGIPITTPIVLNEDGSLRFTLPDNAPSGGEISVVVSNPGALPSNPSGIAINPNLTNGTQVGTSLVINATNLPIAQVIVSFNGQQYLVMSTSNTQLIFPIPTGTPPGTYSLTVLYQQDPNISVVVSNPILVAVA